MSFFDKIFGTAATPIPAEEPSHQLPSNIVAREFGEVNVRKRGGNCEVLFTILMEPQGQEAEGWQTGVALDASASMQGPFGRLLLGSPSSSDVEMYAKKGWVESIKQDGCTYRRWDNRATDEMIRRGVFKYSENDVEPRAREMTAYLARNLDADGGTTVIYWACGTGAEIEVLGDFTAEQCAGASFTGPTKGDFGNQTILTPAVKYFADRFSDAKNGMYVFITDGELNDLPEVKKYTIELCRDIEAKRRNPLKCVLIGLGDKINEDQMEQLDDLDSGTSIDLWDHKIAKTMRDLKEIFAEVVDEHTIVASSAKILDAAGNVVKDFSDGLPAKVSFTMPATSAFFILDVAGNQIKQPIVFK